MTVNILACPSCKSLVLPDTAQCPNCHHVFDERRATTTEYSPSANRTEAPEEEVPCPGCNELVRKGLVRCWNCGTFMQQDIAETYRRMQISPPRVIYSDIKHEMAPDAGAFAGDLTDSGRLVTPAAPPQAGDELDDADFEVSIDLSESGDDGEDFDLGTAAAPDLPNEIVESAPIFALKTAPEEAPAGKTPSGGSATATKTGAPEADKASKSASKQDFRNEFDDRFGIDEQGATGEGLLRVALAEEAETGGRRRAQKQLEGGPSRAGFRVY